MKRRNFLKSIMSAVAASIFPIPKPLPADAVDVIIPSVSGNVGEIIIGETIYISGQFSSMSGLSTDKAARRNGESSIWNSVWDEIN